MTDAYEAYIEERRRREAELPEPPAEVEFTLPREVAESLLYLIQDNIGRYGIKSQAVLARAFKKLEESLGTPNPK